MTTDSTSAGLRVEFDATIDEVVDVQIRLLKRTETRNRLKRQQVLFTGFAGAVGLPLALLSQIRPLSFPLIVAVITVGVAVGVLVAYLYGHYFEWHVRHYTRRLIAETSTGAGALVQEIELRTMGVWCRTGGMEITLPWAQITHVTDAVDAVELWFSLPALVRVPSRAFSSDESRRVFLREVRTLAPQTLPA
jgi:hypothetical protein